MASVRLNPGGLRGSAREKTIAQDLGGTRAPPVFEPFRRIRSIVATPAHVLIACMPKSGSTFLSDVIAELPGFRRAYLMPAHGRREQELDEFCLQQADPFNFVAQNHVRYSEWTAEMCADYGLTPIVLVRSLLDVIVSLRDHVRNESTILPVLFVEPHHVALDDAKLEAMLARLALPWYINFYMGWRRAPGAHIVNYEDLISAPADVVREILSFAGASTSDADVEAAVAHVRAARRSRMNVGVSGRGATLRPETIRTVLEMIDFYPEAVLDPYIQSVRAQALAALSATQRPARRVAPPQHVPPATSWLRRWLDGRGKHAFMRGVLPLALAAMGVLYWMWPSDLFADTRPFGRFDDIAVLLLCGVFAGRLTKYKPVNPLGLPLRRRGWAFPRIGSASSVRPMAIPRASDAVSTGLAKR
jgi:hypothetical protein